MARRITASSRPEVLDDDQCWEFLRYRRVGRLAVVGPDGTPEIYPLTYAVAHRRIFVKTDPGTTLVRLANQADVAFETDVSGAGIAPTSAVVKGRAKTLDHADDVAEAEATDLPAGLKRNKSIWLRIAPRTISGRRLTY